MSFLDRTRRSIATLLARAGQSQAGAPEQAIESLEPRQLLAVFTIDPSSVDPLTGLGSVQANFAYFVPYISYTTAPQPQQPITPSLEDFNRAEPPGPGGAGPNPATPIPNGFTFTTSSIRVDFLPGTANPALPFANPQPIGGLDLVVIDPANSNNGIRALFGERQYLSFRAAFSNTAPGNANSLLVNSMSMDISGLDTDTTSVQIISDATVVQTLTGAALANLGANVGGGFRRYTFTLPGAQTFDQIRFVKAAGAPSGTTLFDNVAYTVPGGSGFGTLVDGRQRGFTARLTGPAGASFEIFDLYNRALRPNVGVGIPAQSPAPITIADPADTGVPRFNDGIGRIVISGTNTRSAFTILGATIQSFTDNPPANADFVLSNGFAGVYPTSLTDFYDGLEQSGYGFYTQIQGTQVTVSGLPAGAGTVVVGAPFVRNLGSYVNNPVGVANPGGIVNYSSLSQGVFVQGDIGTLSVPGILHGTSVISGRAERFNVDYMLGSLRVGGDLGSFINSGDAGLWVSDNVDNAQGGSKTGSQLIVGRTLGQFHVGGRSLMDITVTGDLSSPTSAPSRDVYQYREREHMLFNTRPTGTGFDARFQYRQMLLDTGREYEPTDFGFFGFASTRNQQILFGGGYFRNDTVLSSEFVGNASTAAEIVGRLGGADIFNTREDPSDVYAFPATAGQEIVVRPGRDVAGFIASLGLGFGNAYARIVDVDGRTLAAVRADQADSDRSLTQLRFTPTQSGVYYLVVQAADAPAGSVADIPYALSITGMAAVTMGLLRTGSGLGSVTGGTLGGLSATVTVLSGALGSIRVATGFLNGGGAEVAPDTIYNPSFGTALGLGDESAFGRAAIAVPAGDLYSIVAGNDIKTLGATQNITVGGNLWMVHTGQSNLFQRGPTNGDLRQVAWSIGGRIGLIDVRSAIGVNTDADASVEGNRPIDGPGSVAIASGRNSQLRGDIGLIRVGRTVGGAVLSITTPDNSSIGGLVVTQDQEIGNPTFGGVRPGAGPGQFPVTLNIGNNSDLRFFDAEFVSGNGVVGVISTLLPNVPLTFTDDSGARVTLNIVPGPNGGGSGFLNILPVRGGQGSAIGRINVDLSDGASLSITSVQPQGSTDPQDVVSIGRIVVSAATADSAINITGPVQVDVWRIEQQGQDPFGSITNTTPRGDIVAIDMAQLSTLTIGTGDLGRTQSPQGLNVRFAPELGIARGQPAADARAAFSIPQAAITPFWNGATFRPVNNSLVAGGISFADDVGMPIDTLLNGVRVRNGSVQSVLVGGGIGDIIVPQGEIVLARANNDVATVAGRFEGIFGNVYANRIREVDIGQGLDGLTTSPFAGASIVADDDISAIIGSQAGANVRGLITVRNINPANAVPDLYNTDGIDSMNLSGGGSFIDASVVAGYLSDYWQSIFSGDDNIFAGRVTTLNTQQPAGPLGLPAASGGGFIRSFLRADSLTNVTIGGVYDASLVEVGNAGSNLIQAREFRNSTLQGGELEQRANRITSAGDIGTITTTGQNGDISDLTIAGSRNIAEVSARNIDRSRINAVSQLSLLRTTNSVRGSSVLSGFLPRIDIAQSLIASTVEAAGGTIGDLEARGSIVNSNIRATGPDGRITRVTSPSISGEIFSVGRIEAVEATAGDLRATITTVISQRGVAGSVGLLRAARDLDIDGDIAGKVDVLRAGRHVGNRTAPKVLVLRGDLDLIDAPFGTLYNDIRTTGAVAQATFGRVDNKPGTSILGRGGLYAFGRIQNVNITGDWNGNIVSYSGGIGVVAVAQGSILAGANINAFSGDIGNIFITDGHLLGNVHADWTLFNIRINASADGVFGDIGINPALSAGVSADAFRNQLPPGVIGTGNADGPRITAGRNIGRIFLTGGSIFEASIIAGRALGTVEIIGDIRNDNASSGFGTLIAAGSSIFAVSATGSIQNARIIAGLVGLGADNTPGGTGANADLMQSGRITSVRSTGQMANTAVIAGVQGVQFSGTTVDFSSAQVVLGTSFIRAITAGGGVANVVALADSPTVEATAGILLAGTSFGNADPDVSNGFLPGTLLTSGVTLNTALDGNSLAVTFTGRGRASYDAATRTITLVNTGLNSTLSVTARNSQGGVADLAGFRIVTNDDASMGQITVDANLLGDSRIVIDAYSLGVATGNVSGSTRIAAGMNIRGLTTGSFTSGTFEAPFWVREIRVNGNFGTAGGASSSVQALAAGGIDITGNHSGLISVDRDLGPVNIGGVMNAGRLRAGSNLGALTIGSINGSRISAGDSIASIAVAGSANEVNIQAGGDLGRDGTPGGSGLNADSVRAASIGNVTIGGDFERASLVAGTLRGPDGFFGTVDDSIAPGRSTIGNVTIAGSRVGSNSFSEQYRIAASTSIGTVTVAGNTPSTDGNFRAAAIPQDASSIRVLDIRTEQIGGVWTASIQFNQPMDVSTILPALTIAQVRDSGNTLIPIALGSEYLAGEWTPGINVYTIRFRTEVTSRPLVASGPLPTVAGNSVSATESTTLPGPGVYRFSLNGAVLRAAQAAARLDANNDGTPGSSEVFVRDRVVGDAGDRAVGPAIVATDTGLGTVGLVSLRDAVDLDLVLRDPFASSNLPQINSTNTIRGVIGDHPNQNTGGFTGASDNDVYRLTLQAGQILQLSSLQGNARNASIAVLFFDGTNFFFENGDTGRTLALPAPSAPLDAPADFTFFPSQNLLIKRSGTYFILVGNNLASTIGQPTVPSVPLNANTFGDYNFTINVFDDGNTGFNGGTAAGSAEAVPNAPLPIVFAGADGQFGTSDDRTQVVISGFTFTLNRGADNAPNTGDDIVSGTNPTGLITSERRSGNQLSVISNDAIGPRGHRGVPGDLISPDADIFTLNNGAPIPAGRPITIRVNLAQFGADLGSVNIASGQNFNGSAQFGIFDVTGSTGIDDGLLVFSSSDFKSIPQGQRVIASDTNSSYGYDADGNFFITFVAPGRIGAPAGTAASYAIMVQGVYNTDYQVVVTQTDNTVVAAPTPRRQNILIETRGGTVNWLEVSGLTTVLAPYSTSVLGFNGSFSGVPVDRYVLDRTVAAVQNIFTASGLDVVVSADPSAFEFQDYSTIFLSSTTDPKTVFNTTNFGYSEHVDALNLDRRDEGVVFMPSLAELGFNASLSDANALGDALSAAITRRAAELMGARITVDSGFSDTNIDVMSANSVFNVPFTGQSYRILDEVRRLSDPTNIDSIIETDFFLGSQNAFGLLRKFVNNS